MLIHVIAKPVFRLHNYATFKRNWLLNKDRFGDEFTPNTEDFKRNLVAEYAKKYQIDVFIETGTYYGDMVHSQLGNFKEIHSIELMPSLHKKAVERFGNAENVHMHQGNSGWIIKSIVDELNSSAIFWLDAHFQKDVGVKFGDQIDAPVKDELEAIFKSNMGHVVLIDDARFFTGVRNYPSLDWIEKFLKELTVEYKLNVEADIIRIVPC